MCQSPDINIVNSFVMVVGAVDDPVGDTLIVHDYKIQIIPLFTLLNARYEDA